MWLSFIKSLFGSDGVKGPITTLLERWIPDKDARQKAAEEMEQALLVACQKQDEQQNEVNKIEAASSSVFVAGWRPFIGWVCGFGMAWQYVLEPMLTWAFALYAAKTGQALPPLPKLDTSEMTVVLTGMLGLGGLRTYEKFKGVDRSTLAEK